MGDLGLERLVHEIGRCLEGQNTLVKGVTSGLCLRAHKADAIPKLVKRGLYIRNNAGKLS